MRAINPLHIVEADYSHIDELVLEVRLVTGEVRTLRDIDALEGIMALCPAAIEGKKLRWARHVWAIHNLFGHPLLQIAAWLKLYKLGFWLHDSTVPNPKGRKGL